MLLEVEQLLVVVRAVAKLLIAVAAAEMAVVAVTTVVAMTVAVVAVAVETVGARLLIPRVLKHSDIYSSSYTVFYPACNCC